MGREAPDDGHQLGGLHTNAGPGLGPGVSSNTQRVTKGSSC